MTDADIQHNTIEFKINEDNLKKRASLLIYNK